MATTRQRQEFRVVIDGVTIPKSAVNQINKAIQRTVATEMAQLDLNKGNLIYHIDPDWIGIWLRSMSRAELQKAGIVFEQRIGR